MERKNIKRNKNLCLQKSVLQYTGRILTRAPHCKSYMILGGTTCTVVQFNLYIPV